VLYERLRDECRAHDFEVPIYPAMTFTSHGLVLGAGTVLLRADGPRRLQSPQGEETRVLALLSAAYGRAIAPSVVGNIERAVKAWSEGDDCLAFIHLAHASLKQLKDFRMGAYRLEMAQCAMKHGASPRAVFKALNLDAHYIDAVEKEYDPAESRVPAGSGRTSGEWTAGAETDGDAAASAGEATAAEGTQRSSLPASMPLPASSFLGELDAAQVAELGAYASRVLGPAGAAAAVFGLLFIPSANNVRVEGEVPEIPGLRYSWNRDETVLHLTYDAANGQRSTFTAQLEEDVFRDQNGTIVARILPGGAIVVDAAAVFPDSANDNEPRLCPMPGLDRPGERGRDYEDYIKSIVNPVDTTPRYWGFQLVDPGTGKFVYYDDCQHTTGMMVDAKGPGYASLLTYNWGVRSITTQFLSQSMRQIDAAGSRTVCWYFAEQAAADFARQLFIQYDKGREKIEIEVESWP
jgi:hypothetical protein